MGNSRKQSPFNSFRLGWIQSAQTVISTSPAGLLESRQPWSNREENKNEMSFRGRGMVNPPAFSGGDPVRTPVSAPTRTNAAIHLGGSNFLNSVGRDCGGGEGKRRICSCMT